MVSSPRFGVLLLLLTSLVAVPARSNPPYIQSVVVREGGGFLMVMGNDPKEPKRDCCRVNRNDVPYNLANVASKTTANGELLEIVRMQNDCMVRVLQTNMDSQGIWKLTNQGGTCRRYNITILPATENFDCPTTPSDACLLIDSVTKEERPCGADVSEWKQYKCQFKVPGSLAYKEVAYPKPARYIRDPTGWVEVKESETYGNYLLECQTNDEVHIKHCTAEHLSSQRLYNIGDGLQHKKYSSFKTEFEDGVCQFEIPKSGEDVDEEDIGKWRMNVTDVGDKDVVCHFLLDTPARKLKRSPEKEQINMMIGTKVNCAENVPYKVTRCYIRTPDLNIERNNAACEFTLNMPGEWICGYNSASWEHADVELKINVVESGAIDGQYNLAERVMSCSHIHGKQLKTCLFISPSMRPFSVPQAKLIQAPRGLCEITIEDEKDFEMGVWKCVIQEKNQDDYYSLDINLMNSIKWDEGEVEVQ